jgi:hypothetical protein
MVLALRLTQSKIKTMKTRLNFLTLILALFTSGIVKAEGNELFNIDSEKVGVRFENNGNDFIMTFDDDKLDKMHSVIDMSRTTDLKYKTRVMRYFGGLLVNKTFLFKNLIVITKDGKYEMPFTRENISKIVNMMCSNPLSTSTGQNTEAPPTVK